MTGRQRPAIRTPDQRIRVFVSSTLRELADERGAVRRAIERLRMAPVMFELGARPHPPRDLYRAYLEQSDVFVGIYAASYGWVAPEEEISGLEDEYRLAPRDMPRLMYVKAGVEREERLGELIERIQRDDTASYKPYETAADLEELVLSDLATLLAERFDAAPREAPAAPLSHVPVPFTPIIGREDAIEQVRGMLAEPGTRMITLLGPGASARAGSRSRSRARPPTCSPAAPSSCRSRTSSSRDCSSPRSATSSASAMPASCRSRSASASRSPGDGCSSSSTTSSSS